MQLGERFSIFLKISLPLLILILLKISPLPYVVANDLRSARVAEQLQTALPAEAEQSLTVQQSQTAAQSATAASALLRVLNREPWRVKLWEQVGLAQLSAGKVAEAIDALRRAEQAGTLSPEGRFQLGEAYLRQGDLRAARDTWQALLRLEGPSARVFERLFEVQRAQHDAAAAVQVLREWHKFVPQDAKVTYLLGLHLSAVQPDEAAPLLVEAAQKDGMYSPPVQVIRRGLGQASAAKDPAYGWLMIGRALGSIDQWEVAEEAFRQALRVSPNYAEAWGFLGEALYHIDGSGKAELDKASALAPASPVVRALLALYWRRQGNMEKALEYLQAVARDEPDEPIWQVEIGNALVESGDLDAARQAFQKAVDLAPKISLYWRYLAMFSVQYNVDVHELGLPAARQAVLLAPGDADALDTMGWTLANLGDSASAERFLQRALEKDATYAPACLHLGQLYLQQQKNEQAYLYLKRAAGLAGDTQVGTIARRLLKDYYGEGG